MVYGACLSSFTVQDFSLKRLAEVKREDVEERFKTIKDMVRL